MPNYIVIEFPSYTRKGLLEPSDKLVAILPHTYKFKFENKDCLRT